MVRTVPTWSFESRMVRRQREQASMANLRTQVAPLVASGQPEDLARAQALVQAPRQAERLAAYKERLNKGAQSFLTEKFQGAVAATKQAIDAASVEKPKGGGGGGGVLGRLKDVAGEVGGDALSVLGMPQKYVGAPLAGNLIRTAKSTVADIKAAPSDPMAALRIAGRVGLMGVGGGLVPGALQEAVGRTVSSPGGYQTGREAYQQDVTENPNLPVGAKVAAGVLTDPLTYIGPGAVKSALRFAPEAIRAGRAAGILGSVLEQPMAAGVGGAIGAGAGAEIANRAGLSPGQSTLLTLAGGVVGGAAPALGSRATGLRRPVLDESVAAAPLIGVGGQGAETALTSSMPAPLSRGLPEISGGSVAAGALPGLAPVTVGPPKGLTDFLNRRLALRQKTQEAGVREGVLLKPRSKEQLSGGVVTVTPTGAHYTPKEALDVAADLARQQSSVVNSLHSWGVEAFKKMGRMDDQGHLLDVAPTQADIAAGLDRPSFYDVVQNPEAYQLTEAQKQGISDLTVALDKVKQERVLRGVGPNELKIEYYPRLAKQDSKLRDLQNRISGGGNRLGGAKDKSRVFDTAREAESQGVIYAHPLEAFDAYNQRGLKVAVDAHVKSLLEPFGQTAGDRVPEAVRAKHDALVSTVASLRARLQTAEKRYGINSTASDELQRALDGVQEATPVGVSDVAKLPAISRGQQARVDAMAQQAENLRADQYGQPITGMGVRIKVPATPAAVARASTLEATAEKMNSVVGAFNKAIPDDVERLRSLDTALLNTAKRTEELAQRGGKAAKTAASLRNDLVLARRDLEQFAPKWKATLERARAIPPDRAAVSQALAPALIGRDFEPNVAKSISNFYGRMVNDTTTQTGRVKAGVRAVNATLTPLKATMDASALLNQQGRVAVLNPGLYLKNVAKSMRDVVSDTSYNELMASPKGMRAAKAGVALLGDVGDKNEFQFSNWMQRVPVAGALPRWAGNHYVRFNNRQRIELFDVITEAQAKMGKALDARGEEELAKGINRLTGVSTGRAGDLETLAEFAPNFFRSHLESLAHGIGDGSIEGQVARRYLGTFFGAGAMLVGGVAVAQGRDPGEVLNPLDMSALANGDIRFNPNFGTVRVGQSDISVYGPFGSLARLAAAGAEIASVNDRGIRERLLTALDAATTKASPAAGLVADVARGETFTGQDPLSLGATVERATPISVSNYLAGQRQGLSVQDSILDSVGNAIGANVNQTTPTERLNQIAERQYGAGFYDVAPKDRDAIKKANPALWEEAVAKGSDKRQRAEVLRTETRAAQDALDAKVLAGGMTREEWNAAIGDRQQELQAKLAEIYGGEPIAKPKTAVDRYINAINEATDPATKQVDWTAVDTWKAAQPQADLDYIEANTGLNNTPLMKLGKALSAAYYAVPKYAGYNGDQAGAIDDAYIEVRNAVKTSQDRAGMLRALSRLPIADPKVRRGVAAKIYGQLIDTGQRERWRRAHPESALILGVGALQPRDATAIQRALDTQKAAA